MNKKIKCGNCGKKFIEDKLNKIVILIRSLSDTSMKFTECTSKYYCKKCHKIFLARIEDTF